MLADGCPVPSNGAPVEASSGPASNGVPSRRNRDSNPVVRIGPSDTGTNVNVPEPPDVPPNPTPRALTPTEEARGSVRNGGSPPRLSGGVAAAAVTSGAGVVAGGGVATEPPVEVLTGADRRRAGAARSRRLRLIVARRARVASVGFALLVVEGVDATLERAGDATLATTCFADVAAVDSGCVGRLVDDAMAGTLTGGTATCGVATLGVVTDGVVTGGVETDGVLTAGVVATGVVTDGTVTAGTDTAGTVTAGTVTAGTVTTGVEIPGVVRPPIGLPLPSSPSA